MVQKGAYVAGRQRDSSTVYAALSQIQRTMEEALSSPAGILETAINSVSGEVEKLNFAAEGGGGGNIQLASLESVRQLLGTNDTDAKAHTRSSQRTLVDVVIV